MNVIGLSRAVAAGLCVLLVVPTAACRRSPAGGAAADAGALAPLTVRDDSQGLLLTWIDDKGDFHIEQKASDVPLVGRDAVRVVDPGRDDGSQGDTVYVADLRVAGADGTYPVHTMSREDFDALAVARRAKNNATLATGPAGAGAAPGAPSAAGAPSSDTAVAGRPAVIVYGASWCSACHQAEAYFKQRGILYVEHDVEKEPEAAAEMRSKLRRAGLRDGSIPVIDVRGHIMVGFDPRSIESALGSPI